MIISLAAAHSSSALLVLPFRGVTAPRIGARSLPEFDALLHRAGLRRCTVLTTNSPQTVIEAVAG